MTDKFIKDNNRLIDRILDTKGDFLFFSFTNDDGKRWVMPQRNMVTAMNLYQPSSWRGKLVKQLLPLLNQVGFVRRKLGMQHHHYELCDLLKQVLSRLLKSENLEFSLFGGTPSVHQKITIQINVGHKILGYCKVSDKENIKAIFKHEQKVLDTLKKKGVKQIPECLYCGTLKEDIDLFVQTTQKTNSSKIPIKWHNLHWSFLTHLHTKTRQSLPFEKTDFNQSLQLLDQNKYLFSERENEIITNALSCIIKKHRDKQVCFSAYHSDFTPWNMIVENGKLFVFDFEYAKMTYPPFLDRFHFFTQVSIYDKHWSANQIFAEYKLKLRGDIAYIKDPDMAYLCYLVDIVSFYIDRDKGDYNDDVETSLSKWISLISLLSKD